MSAATTGETSGAKPAGKGGKRKLMIILAAVVLLVGGLGGLWMSGLLFKKSGDASHAEGAQGAPPPRPALIFVEIPDMIANLNVNGRKPSFVKLKSRLEVARAEDQALVLAAMPRIVDLFQTYLREMRPEEMRGSAGTYRLREELIARANIAVAPARVLDLLFTELLVQ